MKSIINFLYEFQPIGQIAKNIKSRYQQYDDALNLPKNDMSQSGISKARAAMGSDTKANLMDNKGNLISRIARSLGSN